MFSLPQGQDFISSPRIYRTRSVDTLSLNEERKRILKELKKIFPNQRKRSKLATFTERLSHYTTIFFEADNIKYREHVRQYYHLEESWNHVIKEDVYMTRKMKMQQQTIWEFLTTERNYIKKLRVIVEVFQQCLKICQSEGDLQQINERCIFSNINEILLANDELWTKHLIQVINYARATKAPIQPSVLLDSFHHFERLFKPYVDFCLIQDSCLKTIREMTDISDLKRSEMSKNFSEYLKWCESLRQCERFKLADLMTEPMQRLTRYPLLLKKIKKETKDIKEIEIMDVIITKVERFISNINKTLRKRYEEEKLEECLDQFEYFSTMEAANEEVKWTAIDFLRLNVPNLQMEEQRCILKQGPMKLLEKKNRNETHVFGFLFTDVFLLGKYKKSSNKIRIIKQLFYLDKIKLIKSEVSESSFVIVYLDEFGLLQTTFMLDVDDKERDVWIGTIERTKQRFQNARIGRGSTLDFFQDANSTPSDIVTEDIIDNKNVTHGTKQQGLINKSLPENRTANWLLGNSPRVEEIDRNENFGHTRLHAVDSFISDNGYVPSEEPRAFLRQCSSVPEFAKAGLLEDKPISRHRKSNSLRDKPLVGKPKPNASCSEDIQTSETEEKHAISSSSSESLNSKSINDLENTIDQNNNVKNTSKIRHLIYGRIDFGHDKKSYTLNPNMKFFKNTSTQTDREITAPKVKLTLPSETRSNSGSFLSEFDEEVFSEPIYDDVIVDSTMINNQETTNISKSQNMQTDISFSTSIFHIIDSKKFKDSIIPEKEEIYYEEDYLENS